MSANTQFGPVFNLADWLEDQPGITATVIYVGESADPERGATTVSFRPYGSEPRQGTDHAIQHFQAVGRGLGAYEGLMECYGILAGLETTIDGVGLTVVPLQSAPVYLGPEDNGGTQWVQNYRLEWLVE